MSQVPLAPPPPSGNSGFDRWMYFLWRRLTQAGQILWATIDKSGSNLTDIETRNHADLQNLNTSSYSHLTGTQLTDLTEGNDSTLHYHATDRDRANHTGTQLAETISDFAAAVGAVATPVTVTDTNTIDLTLTGQDVSADVKQMNLSYVLAFSAAH